MHRGHKKYLIKVKRMGMQIPILFAPKLFEGCAIIINVDFTIAESVNYIYNFALYA